MRPRVIPAENAAAIDDEIGGERCFNEAAGNPRGKRTASSPGTGTSCCFNEAAGNPRGKPKETSMHYHYHVLQ